MQTVPLLPALIIFVRTARETKMQTAILLFGPANVIIVESIRQKELEEKVFDPTKTEFRMQLLKKDGKLER